MGNKTKVIIAAIALLTAFAFGRFSAPTYEKTTKDATETADTTKSKDTDSNAREETDTTEEHLPDGTTRKTTKTVKEKNRKSTEDQASNASKSASESTEIIRDSGKVTISALAGISISNPLGIDYGLSVTRPVLGPITLGLWGLKSGTVGASLGLTF